MAVNVQKNTALFLFNWFLGKSLGGINHTKISSSLYIIFHFT